MRLTTRLAVTVLSGASALFVADRPAPADVPAGPAKDWPQFHGPARDNLSRETGLLREWPKDGPPLAWSVKGVGAGYSSVSVAGGRIYTAGEDGDGAFVVALGEADGKRIWKSPLGKKASPGGYAGTRATPTVDGDTVYMIGQVGDVVAYAAADGTERWRVNLNKDFGGQMMSGWGNSESVLIDGERLICTPGGKGGTVLALEKATGKVAWRSKDFTDAAAYASPFIATIAGARAVVTLTDHSVAGVAPETGALLWRADRPGQTAVIPTPLVMNDHVFTTSGYGVGCTLFKVGKAGDGYKVDKVYSNKNMVNHHGGVVLLDGNVYGYCDGKGWTCVDFMSGEARWKDKSLGKGTLTYADGRFYLRDEGGKGTLALIEASPEKYAEHGRFDQPERSGREAWPHLVVANGRMYVRDQDALLCYNVKGN